METAEAGHAERGECDGQDFGGVLRKVLGHLYARRGYPWRRLAHHEGSSTARPTRAGAADARSRSSLRDGGRPRPALDAFILEGAEQLAAAPRDLTGA